MGEDAASSSEPSLLDMSSFARSSVDTLLSASPIRATTTCVPQIFVNGVTE